MHMRQTIAIVTYIDILIDLVVSTLSHSDPDFILQQDNVSPQDSTRKTFLAAYPCPRIPLGSIA